MKKIVLAIVVLIIIFGGYITYQNNMKTIKKGRISSDYYQKLKDGCLKHTDELQSCCLDSVKAMEVVGGTLATGSKVVTEHCKDGYKRMTLRCPSSLAWCQTDPNNGINNKTTPNIPQNEPKITPQEITSQKVITKRERIQLPDNVITEKECSAQGGEVWNTLGETSYEGELIGKVEGLDCPCACLIKPEPSNIIWVNINGKVEEFKGNLDDIKTYDDCKKAGFKIRDSEPETCQTGEAYMTGGKFKTFTNNPMEAGKKCTDYHYSTCPGVCVAKCISSSCSEPDENGAVACTSDCDGEGSCIAR